jgi:hypothetical protein
VKATIRDADTLRSIRPLEMASYLRAGGWQETQLVAGQRAVWNFRGAEFEAVVPLDHSCGDYAMRISDILRTLELVEERSQIEILNDLAITSADVIRLRIGNKLSDGSVPIEEGVKFVEKSRDMMMAAACATVDRRACFPTRKSVQAMEYVRKLRMGQTERGSFVMTIISRVPPALSAPDRLFDANDPFERQVTSTLAQALSSLRSAAENGAAKGEMVPFQESVREGVSANLCDSIVGISSAGEDSRDIEIDFSWARTRPQASSVPRRVLISADAVPVIAEAARHFRETSPREEFELHGPVVKLERPEGSPTGRVTVSSFVDDQPRKVTLELPENEYHKALRAHKHEQFVFCYGVLVREGRSYSLKDPRELTVDIES